MPQVAVLDDASHFRRICVQLEACPGQQANEGELKVGGRGALPRRAGNSLLSTLGWFRHQGTCVPQRRPPLPPCPPPQAVLGFRGQRGHRLWRRVKPALAKRGHIEELLARTEADKPVKCVVAGFCCCTSVLQVLQSTFKLGGVLPLAVLVLQSVALFPCAAVDPAAPASSIMLIPCSALSLIPPCPLAGASSCSSPGRTRDQIRKPARRRRGAARAPAGWPWAARWGWGGPEALHAAVQAGSCRSCRQPRRRQACVHVMSRQGPH